MFLKVLMKRIDEPAVRCRLRPDKTVAVTRGHCLTERQHQKPVGNSLPAQQKIGDRNTVPADGRHAGLFKGIEDFPTRKTGLSRSARTFEPPSPVPAVRRRVDKLTAGKGMARPVKQCRRADRHKPFPEKPPACCPRAELPFPEQNCTVKRLAAEIDSVGIHPDTGQFHTGRISLFLKGA